MPGKNAKKPEAGRLLTRLAHELFPEPEQREAFIAALTTPKRLPQALIWCKPRPETLPFPIEPPAPFQPEFVDRVLHEHRPGATSLHEEGYYYVLDSSSLFCASVLEAVPEAPELSLDLCSAPGGKGIFFWRSRRPKKLLLNEVIGKRLPALISNVERCGIAPAMVLRSDPAVLAPLLEGSLDALIADVPCSGQSLLAKGGTAPGCFHPTLINKNAVRQRRIAANAATMLAPGGYLAYMTCTFSRQENEGVMEWLLKKFPELTPVPLPALAPHQTALADFPAYRLFPFEGIGAGGFAALLRREPGEKPRKLASLGMLRAVRSYDGG